MPETAEEQNFLSDADAAAEAQAAALRNGSPPPESRRIEVSVDREKDLDDVFSQVGESAGSSGELGLDNGGVRMPLEGEPPAPTAEEVKAREEAAAAKTTAAAADEAAAAAKASTGEKKGLLDSVLSDSTAAKPDVPADPYGEVKLRSDASPKTRETFEQLKTLAKQREETALAQATESKKALEELQAKVTELEKRSLAPETEAELKELREFRAQYGAEQTPEFRQKYDGRIDGNYSAIYERLGAHGLAASEIEKLKAFSLADRDAAIEGFLEKLDTDGRTRASRRFIELKLADNLNAAEERQKALSEIKGKAAEIVAKERTAPAEQAQQRLQDTAALLKPAIAKLPWFHLKDIPATASAEEKKTLEAHNKAAAEYQDGLKFVLTNDTPASRAEAAIAVPLALQLRRENASLIEKLAAVEKELGAIKAASRTARTARSSASPNGSPAPAPKVNEESGDALDTIFKEVNGRR
jgi:hypothetical protein